MSGNHTDPLSSLRDKATVTVTEAADALGISRETAYRWAREGTIPGVLRMGPRTVRIRTSDLIGILEPSSGDAARN